MTDQQQPRIPKRPTHPLQKEREVVTQKMDERPPQEKPDSEVAPPPLQPGFYPDGSPMPAPYPLSLVNVVPEDLPWQLLRDEWTPSAHAYFVREINSASKNALQQGAAANSRYYSIQPVVLLPTEAGGGGPDGSGEGLLPAAKPVPGAAYFSTRDLAHSYFQQINLAWVSWCRALRLPRSETHLNFVLAGPWSRVEIMHMVSGPKVGRDPMALLSSKTLLGSANLAASQPAVYGMRLSSTLLELDRQIPDWRSQEPTDLISWDSERGMERFPLWWIHPLEFPTMGYLNDGLPSYGDAPWAPSAVVPWVEIPKDLKDPKDPKTWMVQPTPQPLALFEDDGLACDFARSFAFAVGHVTGRLPLPYEKPYMFNQIYVYARMNIGNMWDDKRPTRFPAWCKSHPPVFTAICGQGGVTTISSEGGYEADNRETPMSLQMATTLLSGFHDRTGKAVTPEDIGFLDCPPTPNTTHAMESEDFPIELFSN